MSTSTRTLAEKLTIDSDYRQYLMSIVDDKDGINLRRMSAEADQLASETGGWYKVVKYARQTLSVERYGTCCGGMVVYETDIYPKEECEK